MSEGSELTPKGSMRNAGIESDVTAEHLRSRSVRPTGRRAPPDEDRWLGFLAEAGTVLAASLDCETVLADLVRLAVPRIADWCVVHLVEDGRVDRVATAHAVPAKEELAHELARRYPLDGTHPFTALLPLKTGRTELRPELSDATLREQARDEDEFRLLRAIAPKSEIATPLVARGHVVGLIDLLITDSPRRYGPADVERVEQLAILAALAIDNSRLYRAARRELEERTRAEAAREQSLSLLRATLESTTDGILVVSRAGTIRSFNHRFLEMWRFPETTAAGGNDDELLRRAVEQLRNPDEFLDRVTALYGEPTAESFDVLEFKDGRVFERYSRPQRVGTDYVGRVWSFRDITDRVRVERRQRLLAQASDLLASSLDYRDTLKGLAELMVPTLADWSQIDLVEEDGYVHQVAAAHLPPTEPVRAVDYGAHEPTATLEGISARVMRSGEPLFIPDVSDSFLDGLDPEDEQARLLKSAAPRSLLVVPLGARQRRLGAITLALSRRSPRRYTVVDLRVAQELAHRAALAIDNARLYEAALLANRTKSDFLAVMSHELRTPLTAIMGYAELLADGITGPVTERQKSQLARIDTSAHHLLELIEEILSFARIEAGREVVRPETVNARLLVQEVAMLVEPAATKKGLRLVVRPPGPHAVIESDPGKLRQILINLLSNAIKFTEHGEVGISGRIDAGRATFAVWDTGIGIAPQHLEHIFDPFWQVEQPSRRHAGGTGLGLSVTRHLARLLGGEVSIDSKPRQGSTFTVWVPVAAGE